MEPDRLSPEEAALWREADRILDRLLDLPPGERIDALAREPCSDSVRARVLQLLQKEAGSAELLEHARRALGVGHEASPPSHSGRLVGRWVLDAVLGTGGMSVVYAACEQGQPERRVAIKLLAGAIVGSVARERLQREQRALARLHHPHIVPLIEAGVLDDGTPWLAMGLVDGTRIDRHCFDQRLEPAARVRLMIDVAEAVAHAHRALIVHRDLKPGNVLVDVDGEVRLLDFGIAGLLDPGAERTSTQLHALTPEYAAPEQFDGAPPDTTMDVYGLGALLHRLLTGRAPGRPSATDTAPTTPSLSISDDAYADPALRERARIALRGDLDAVLLKALEAEPARRYASAGEFAADLRAWLDARPVLAQRPTLRYRVGKFVRRHRGAVGVAAAAMLAVLTSLGVALWQAQRASDAARVAEQRADEAAHEASRATAVTDFLVSLFGAAAAGTPTTELPTTADLLAMAERRIGKSFDADPRMAGRLLLVMGEVNLSLGRLAEAQTLIEQARAQLQDAPDAQPHDRARVAIELALVHLRAGRFDAALAGVGEARAYAAGIAPSDPALNEALVDAEVGALIGSGRAREAVDVAARHHALVMGDPASLPVYVAGAAFNVGIARTAAGDDVGALASLLAADEAANRLDGDWELRLSIGNALASALRANHRVNEALARRARDLELMRQAYPPGHVRLGQALNNLGSDYNRAGRAGEGLALIDEALPILKARAGARHPSVASAYNNRGASLASLSRHEEALADYATAREIIGPLTTPTDRRLLTILLNEAVSYARLGRGAEALERVARIEAAGSGTAPALLEGANAAAAEALLRLGNAAAAAARARTVLEASAGQASGRRALVLVLLAEALLQQGDTAAARRALDDFDAELERVGPDIDANALRAIREQHRLLRALGGEDEAARTLGAQRSRMVEIFGADDPRVRALDDDTRAADDARP